MPCPISTAEARRSTRPLREQREDGPGIVDLTFACPDVLETAGHTDSNALACLPEPFDRS